MKATFQLDSWDKPVEVSISDEKFRELIKQNGNSVVFAAMEECAELAQTMSKMARSTKTKTAENFAEEFIDALIFMGVMSVYGTDYSELTREQFEEYAIEKHDRFNKRMLDNSVIFRTNSAAKRNAGFNTDLPEVPEEPMEEYLGKHGFVGIGNDPDSESDKDYIILGATERVPEMLHVFMRCVMERDPSLAAAVAADTFDALKRRDQHPVSTPKSSADKAAGKTPPVAKQQIQRLPGIKNSNREKKVIQGLFGNPKKKK